MIYKAENFTFSINEQNGMYATNFCVYAPLTDYTLRDSSYAKKCPVDALELKELADFILSLFERNSWGIRESNPIDEKFHHEYTFKCQSHTSNKSNGFEYEFKILKFKFGQENLSIKIPRELRFFPATGFGETYCLDHCLTKEQLIDLADFIYKVLIIVEDPILI